MKFRLEELEVPEESPFQNDALQRQPVVEFLRDLIKDLKGPFVLALDSPWGTGKTTVVRMLRASLKAEGQRSVYFNAWKEDYVTDPLIPMVAALDELKAGGTNESSNFKVQMQTVKKVASQVAKRSLVAAVKVATMNALDLEDTTEEVLAAAAGESTGDLIESFKREKASLERFRQALESAVASLQTEHPLTFFIDELDRCRPTFAIELLERMKHLFDVKSIVFVLSIDKSQLEAITAVVYGDRIDAPEYLRRFIDLEFALPTLTPKQHTHHLLKRHGFDLFFANRREYSELAYDQDQLSDTFVFLADLFDLSPRVRERCLTRLAVVLKRTEPTHYLHPYAAAFLIILRTKRPDTYRLLISGHLAPRLVIAEIAELAISRGIENTRILTVIEAYLVVGDVNRNRSEKTVRELRSQVSGISPPSETPHFQEAGFLLQLVDNLRFKEFSLKSVARKVDLASWVE